jgi:hypothetical protein
VLGVHDRLRHLDGFDDAASSAMDLEYHGRPELARQFLDWCADFAGDSPPHALRHHYLAYRAAVRARVACLRADQEDTGPGDTGTDSATEARRYAVLACRHIQRAAVRLLLVGGLSGPARAPWPREWPIGRAWSCCPAIGCAKSWPGLTPSIPPPPTIAAACMHRSTPNA